MNDPIVLPPSRGFLAWLVGLGFAWRMAIVMRSAMPREDGVNYLWMAERFAEGHAAQALGEVFSPLLALLIAIPIALGLEPFFAGQVALAVVGAFVVVPVALAAEELRSGTGRIAAWITFVAARPVLYGAWIYTEPLFLLVAACALLAGVRRQFLWCGVWSGVAFWVRPEAAVIPLAFLLGERDWRHWARASLPLAGLIAGLAVWRGVSGHGFHPVPKLPFIQAHNVAADESWFERLVQLPGAYFEAMPILGVLAVLGFLKFRPRPIVLLFLLAVVIIWSYVPRRRFFVNWLFVIAPVAAVAARRVPRRLRLPEIVVAFQALMAFEGGIDIDRIVERELGEELRRQLLPGQVIASDMTRVLYFAGQRPLPPRHFTAAELVERAEGAEFFVLRKHRDYADEVLARLKDFQPWTSGRLHEGMASRGILLLRRK